MSATLEAPVATRKPGYRAVDNRAGVDKLGEAQEAFAVDALVLDVLELLEELLASEDFDELLDELDESLEPEEDPESDEPFAPPLAPLAAPFEERESVR